MPIKPFQYVANRSFRETSPNNATLDVNRYLILTVHCMKVGRRMIARKHADRNAEKSC